MGFVEQQLGFGETSRRYPCTNPIIFHNIYYATCGCKRNIEMTPLCKVEVTLPRVLGSREVRLGGGVDEQAGVQPS